MPFLRLHNRKIKKNHSIANSLRAHLYVLHLKESIKRVSPFTSRKLGASMTIEAAFVLPMFLFFMIQIMSAMNMIGIQSRLSAALHQTGNKMAFAGYVYGKAEGNALTDVLASVALTQIYARSQITDYAGLEYLNQSCIKNGAAGLSFDGTSIMKEQDIIEICLSYHIEPIFPMFGLMGGDGFAMSQRYYGRAWTGYDLTGGYSDFTQDDPMVYITETGTVYHTNRNCTYLNPSVETIGAASIDSRRNQAGGKYYPCEICGLKNPVGTVYITSQGSSYHSSITCSGLKRTIYTVPLSQVQGRGKCSKCG